MITGGALGEAGSACTENRFAGMLGLPVASVATCAATSTVTVPAAAGAIVAS